MSIKFTELLATTSLASNDIFPVVDISEGVNGSKKITMANLASALEPTSVIAYGLIPTLTDSDTRVANRSYIQDLIDENPNRVITIPYGADGAKDYHFDGTLIWPDGSPPMICGQAANLSLHFWSVDPQTVTYYTDADGDPISAVSAEDDLGALVVTQWSNADGYPITADQGADVVNFPGATSSTTRTIRAFIFFSGKPTRQRPVLHTLRFVPRFEGDTDKSVAVYLERTESVGTQDAPFLKDLFIARSGAHTDVAITYTAVDIGYELRGWSLIEGHNLNFSGVEPWQDGQDLFTTTRRSKAGLLTGESFNGIPCINPIISYSSFYSAIYGWRYEGAFSEGGKSLFGNYQEVDVGISFDNMGGTSQPYFTVIGSHTNCNKRNIELLGPRFFFIAHNYFAIKRDTAETDTTAVYVRGDPSSVSSAAYRTYGNVIDGNVFNSIAVAGNSVGIDVDYIHGLNITNNTFLSANEPIKYGANSSGCRESNNRANPHEGETDAAKNAYSGFDFLSDAGTDNGKIVTISADSAQNVDAFGGGLIIDNGGLTADRARNLSPIDFGFDTFTLIVRKGTDSFKANYNDAASSTLIVALPANSWAIVRSNGTSIEMLATGIIGYDGARNINSIATDAAVNVVLASGSQVFHTGTLTANRIMNLLDTNAKTGDRICITRTGAGAFNLTVRDFTVTGNSKALTTNTWCVFVFDGAAWQLAQYSAL